MRKNFVFGVLGAVGLVFLIILFLAASSPSPDSISQSKNRQVKVRVQYDGAWSGSIIDGTTSSNWEGIGDYFKVLTKDDSYGWFVSANAQKQDSYHTRLTISIEDMDGNIIKSASTDSPYGVTLVSVDLS